MINTGRLFDRLSSPFSAVRRKDLVTGVIALSLSLIGGALHAQEHRDLSSLSVDDLMNVEVTSASRKAQKVADTAAAVFVITQDDIRRSGATSIPEILRIVPGLDVARVNGNVWAISARGANGQFANKLLVMIDGRSVYTPLFSGVYWDVQDTLLEDVDRIEVIRGPGGTLWGVNAVNGIINIITKHAVDTQGALVSAGGGAAEGSFAAGRYGGSLGHNGNYRVYGKSFDRPPSVSGANLTHDAWELARAGFRADWASRGGDNFTAQGDIYRGAVTTVEISVLAMAVAVTLGLVIVLLRLYGFPPLNWLARAYVEIMRGTPLLIQLFLIYYGLPQVGIRLNPFLAGIIGLGFNYAASEAENYRAGILAIPRGQTEAAFALGMNRWQALRRVILPQAFRFVIPPVTNDFIAMFKDSSIVSVITMVELTKVYGMLAMSTYDYIGLGLMTAAIYFALSYPASIFANWLEKRLQYDRR